MGTQGCPALPEGSAGERCQAWELQGYVLRRGEGLRVLGTHREVLFWEHKVVTTKKVTGLHTSCPPCPALPCSHAQDRSFLQSQARAGEACGLHLPYLAAA